MVDLAHRKIYQRRNSLAKAGAVKITHKSLGVKRIINASTTYTRIGGSLMDSTVIDAMVRGAKSFTDMYRLLATSGRRIANLTGNESAYITPGCASAIVLTALALGELDESKERVEVLIDVSHRIPYGKAVTFAGKKLVEFGGAGKRSETDLESAISDKTLAIFWIAGKYVGDNALSIETTVRIAKKRGIPVIVDAAAQLPPVSNLSFFTVKAGADLVLFSGGKALCGPQSTGLMLGNSRIIEAAAKLAAPNQGIARAFKVGKEEIFGITQAIENYLERDHEKDLKVWQKSCEKISAKLSKISGLSGEIHEFNQAGQPIPRVEIKFDAKLPSDTPNRVYENLLAQNPAVVLDLDGPLFISPDMLKKGEIKLVIAALKKALL